MERPIPGHVRHVVLLGLGAFVLAGCGLGGNKEVMCRRIADVEVRLLAQAAGKDGVTGDLGDAKKAFFRMCMKRPMDEVQKLYEKAKEAEKLLREKKGKE